MSNYVISGSWWRLVRIYENLDFPLQISTTANKLSSFAIIAQFTNITVFFQLLIQLNYYTNFDRIGKWW